MKLRSRGLGRRELVMDFREYDIARDGDDVVVSGTIREPVNWDFAIRITGADIPGMLRVGLHRHTLSLAARWILHMRSKASTAPAAAGAVPAPVPIAKVARPLRAAPAERPKASPEPAVITHLRPPAVDVQPVSRVSPVPDVSRTPDFGVPRRRGRVPMEPAVAERAAAEGSGR